jgi:hypothetical protein
VPKARLPLNRSTQVSPHTHGRFAVLIGTTNDTPLCESTPSSGTWTGGSVYPTLIRRRFGWGGWAWGCFRPIWTAREPV